MAWYDFILGRNAESDEEKLNPSQYVIARNEGFNIESRENVLSYRNAYEQLEVVHRAVNMIVDACSDIPFLVQDQIPGSSPVYRNIRRTRVDLLLNKEPNPFQDISTFRRNLLIDLLIDGNIFVYFDGQHMYHLPAEKIDIETDETTYKKIVFTLFIEVCQD
jgi:phage portal protein BeeE